MNLHDLNIFATAARLGSVTKAAKALATVQSNVTTRIRLLEEELGTPLFHRHHHGITPTPKGRELLPYAQQLLALAQKAREAVGNQPAAPGSLRIGSLQSTASVRLPEILKAFFAQCHNVDLAVETGTPAELTASVLAYRVDGAFVSGPVDHVELNAVPAFVEELVLLTPPTFPSVAKYLACTPIPKVLVFKPGCSYRQKLEMYLSHAGAGPLNEMEFGTLDGIIGCVSAGLGITLLPRSVIESSGRRRQVRIHALPRETGRVETLFITHKSQIVSSALERLIAVIIAGRKQMESHPGRLLAARG